MAARLGPAAPWNVAIWALATYPVFATISFGQNSLLSLAVFALVYRLLEDGRPFAAGMAAGLLLFKPQLLLGLGIWWLLRGRRALPCWLGLATTGAILAGLSWAVLPGASRAFVEMLRENVGYGGFGLWNMHNPRAFWTLLLPGQESLALALAAASSLVALAAFVAFLWRRTDDVAVCFAAAVYVTLWASPHTMIYEWTLALVPAVLLWEHVPQQRSRWLVLFAVAWAVLFLSTPLAKVQIDRLPIAVQLSVPVLAWVGWVAAREMKTLGLRRVGAAHRDE